MRHKSSRLSWLVPVFGLCQAQPAESQWFPELSEACDAHICMEAGKSNWRADASNYCEEGICLRDSLESLSSLRWNRINADQDFLAADHANPFIGLTDTEHRMLRELGDGEVEERVRLLGKVRASCQPKELSLRLSIPGRNSATVTFATPLASDGGYQGFQVTRIDRQYRITTSRTGSWLRWIHNRFPGIVRMKGPPTAFANYEMGLYAGSVVLFDTEFQLGQPEEYGRHPDCQAR